MKYFTPELLSRYRSPNEAIADAAADEWDRAIDGYRAHLKAIRLHLPRTVRRLISRIPLHDAKFIAYEHPENSPKLLILVQVEATVSVPSRLLQLNYSLAPGPDGGASVRKHGQPQVGDQARGWVLYDEFDMNEKGGFFTHSILLS